MSYRLRYIGGDPANRHIPGVPAADLSVATKRAADALARSGLYEITPPSKDGEGEKESE